MRKTTIALLASAALIAVGCGSAPTDTGPEPVTTEAVPTPVVVHDATLEPGDFGGLP